MKKLFVFIALFAIVGVLSACDSLCVGSECVEGSGGGGNADIDTTIIEYTHINGEGTEVEREGVLLFEYESIEFVKYQFSYLSCTCRAPNVNYWQVMYIEINKEDGSVRQISFDEVDAVDKTHVYKAGLWGDSSPTPGPSQDYSDGKYFAEFEDEFIPWLVGKTLADFEGISVFKNTPYHGVDYNTVTIDDDNGMIDSFAGSSVSTNNMIRAVKVLLAYHGEKY